MGELFEKKGPSHFAHFERGFLCIDLGWWWVRFGIGRSKPEPSPTHNGFMVCDTKSAPKKFRSTIKLVIFYFILIWNIFNSGQNLILHSPRSDKSNLKPAPNLHLNMTHPRPWNSDSLKKESCLTPWPLIWCEDPIKTKEKNKLKDFFF